MSNFKLAGAERSDAGKGVARKLRGAGLIPANLYGHKETALSLAVGEPAVRHILQNQPDSPIVDLTIEGQGAVVNTVIREVQRHPATGRLLHVDLQRINLNEKIRVDVHVETVGTAVGVKDQGGILEHGTRVVSVMCLPNAIPSAIVVNVAKLEIQDVAKLKDYIDDYPDVEFLDDPDTALATVIPPTVEVAPAEVVGEEVEGAVDADAPVKDEGDAS